MHLVTANPELDTVSEDTLPARVAIGAVGRERDGAVRGNSRQFDGTLTLNRSPSVYTVYVDEGGATRSGSSRPLGTGAEPRPPPSASLLRWSAPAPSCDRACARVTCASRGPGRAPRACGFSSDGLVAISWIRMVAQPLWTTRAARLLDRLEHAGHLEQVIPGRGHDVRSSRSAWRSNSRLKRRNAVPSPNCVPCATALPTYRR